MTAATDLWDAVTARYEPNGLITLTNIRNRSAELENTSVGVAAAQSVIDLWPIYAQVAYDPTDATHVEVAVFGVIALLWRRGGTSSEVEQVKWEEVFGSDGLIAKVRRTGPRGHAVPLTNSGVQQASELQGGRPIRGWAESDSLPLGLLPNRRTAR